MLLLRSSVVSFYKILTVFYVLAAKVNGCYAHYSRALYRKMQKLGLVDDYKTKERFRMLVKRLKSLALVPLEDVEDGFNLVLQQFGDYEEDSPEGRFINYYFKVSLFN